MENKTREKVTFRSLVPRKKSWFRKKLLFSYGKKILRLDDS